jgi:uncharacterized protein YecE (DUF72 family)
MKPDGMLPFYAAHLPTVEINNAFYQMPKATILGLTREQRLMKIDY